MNLYLISQEVNNGYDTYDAAIVCAKDEKEAKTIHPDRDEPIVYNSREEALKDMYSTYKFDTWAGLNDIKVQYIGEAAEGIEKGVILASFNAG